MMLVNGCNEKYVGARPIWDVLPEQVCCLLPVVVISVGAMRCGMWVHCTSDLFWMKANKGKEGK